MGFMRHHGVGEGGSASNAHEHGVGEMAPMKKIGGPGKVAPGKKSVTKAQTAPSAQPAATTKTPAAAPAAAPAASPGGMKKIGGPGKMSVKPKAGGEAKPTPGGGGAVSQPTMAKGAFGPSGMGTMHGLDSPMEYNHGTGGWEDHGVSESWIKRHAKTRGVSNDRLESSLKASEGKPGRKREVLAGKLGKAVASRYRRARG